MAKIRVYELAKELGVDNKEIMAKLRTLKIPVKSHMSVVPDEDIERIKESMTESEGATAAGGVEEKRVAKGVIRRRAKPSAEKEPEPEAVPPKVDLSSLKQTARKARREDEEISAKPEVEELGEIPEEWSEEKEKPKKKTSRKAEEVEQVEPPEPEAAREEPAEDPAATKKAAAEKGVKKEPYTQKPELKLVRAPSEKKAPEPEVPAPEPSPAPSPPAVRKMYMKPVIRKTARAPEGEPLPMPGQEAPKSEAEALAAGEDAKKKKKKKKGKTEEPVGVFAEAVPKKKLRRKVAFKMQRGIEGMELADAEQMYLPSRRKISTKKKVAQKTQITTPKAAKRIVRMGETISVADLARQLGVKTQEIIKVLMSEGVMAYEGEQIDLTTAGTVAAMYNYEITQEVFDEDRLLTEARREKPQDLKPRPPVVTVMGHVDHGKTSLLDTIRKTRVTEGEAGAITQHIGAYLVETSSGKICFIDTPGHEAFTQMRARGAKVTDLVVLVVAADDGIMPQTVEAANHAKAAGVPIIVAVNKVDLPTANPQATRQRLSELGLTPEEWGGETLVVDCSAKTGQGVPDLLEAILLQSEMLDLKADVAKAGKGFVVESWLDKGRGPVATVIVQEGRLRRGDTILSGTSHGKIRALLDDRGKPVKKAEPSEPVEVMGMSQVPEPGSEILVLQDDKTARAVAEHRAAKLRQTSIESTGPVKVSLEDLMAKVEEGEIQSLNLVIKSDTQGSAEAIKAAVEKLSKPEVKIHVIHSGVGAVTENDVLLASASNAVIIGFQIKIDAKSKKLAEQEGVQIRVYDIIYHLTDDVKASLEGMLKPEFKEDILGRAEVRKVFKVTKVGAVAGSYVTDGVIRRNAQARLLRAGEVVYTGKFKSLKRITEDVREVAQGFECGIVLENTSNIQEGDIIEAFELVEK